MHNPSSSFTFIGVALLGNLVSGFSCRAPVPPLPTSSAFLRNSLPQHPSACSTNLLNKDTFQRLVPSSTYNPLLVRGGADATTALGSTTTSDDDKPVGTDLNLTTGKVLASLWGSCGVVYILLKAIKRVVPIALEPFTKGEGVVPLTKVQLA